MQLNILPITLDDFTLILKAHHSQAISPSDIKTLILSASDGNIVDALQWKEHIRSNFDAWIESRVPTVKSV